MQREVLLQTSPEPAAEVLPAGHRLEPAAEVLPAGHRLEPAAATSQEGFCPEPVPCGLLTPAPKARAFTPGTDRDAPGTPKTRPIGRNGCSGGASGCSGGAPGRSESMRIRSGARRIVPGAQQDTPGSSQDPNGDLAVRHGNILPGRRGGDGRSGHLRSSREHARLPPEIARAPQRWPGLPADGRVSPRRG